jgi:hypothetical protein
VDLKELQIRLNAFPVLNRSYREQRFSNEQVTEVISLSSSADEEFLEIERLTDFSHKPYKQKNDAGSERTYTVEALSKQALGVEEADIVSYLEQLSDTVQSERAAFPDIDNDKIKQVFNAISAIQDKDILKEITNRINKLSDVARLCIHTEENTQGIQIEYWTTFAETANGIPAQTTLMAHKTPELNKSDAVLLTTADGGRNFYNLESLKAINRFFLTAKDRTLTKNDMLNFCRIEIGKYSQDIQAVRKVWISPKFKEGMIAVMEIRITPLPQFREYLQSGRAGKDLRLRLQQRSPEHFVYKIKIMES